MKMAPALPPVASVMAGLADYATVPAGQIMQARFAASASSTQTANRCLAGGSDV